MKALASFFFILALASSLLAAAYTGNFTLTQNPISDGGKWVSGSAAGTGCFTSGVQCWGDVQTKPGLAFATVASEGCTGQQGQNCNDPTALLTGVWGQNQTAEATIYVSPSIVQGCCHEVELLTELHAFPAHQQRLRNKLQRFRTGLFANRALERADRQLHVLGWGSVDHLQERRQAEGGQKWFVDQHLPNGSLISTTVDATYLGNSPGMGFFVTGDKNYSAFGFSSFTASDGQAVLAPPTNLSGTVN